MIEKYLPPSMLTIQVHLLVHVVDEIEMAGTVHCRWMFFLERFMKTLKGFVRQKARPEGSMAEGWIVQESLVYITEWIAEFDKETQESPMLWRVGEDERLMTDVAHGGGTSKRMDTMLEEKINRFCMLHHPTMDKWLTTYKIAKEERYDARRAFRARQRGRMVRYPPELEVLPRFMPLLWLHQQLTKAEEEGVHVSLEEWEFSRGCFDKYKSYSAAWSRGRHFRVDHIDKKCVTFDSGVMAKFEQASQRRATDQNIVIAEMQYFGLLKEIINADYRSFTILIFDVQWFKVIMEGPNATVRRDVSGFIEVDSTKPWSDLRDTFVLPEHCKQVIFYPKPSDERWWYVIEVAPRVPTPGDRFGREYMLLREYLKHRRDDARRATQRPDWLDREEWRQIREERVMAPDRWEQQRRASRARIDAGSSHHLGSGGWGSFDEDFSPYTEPLTRAELPDPPQL
ncbi:hypothetical protein L7F22_028388 [Adiantum nelumboides]|nr:hypothetical protein [Adiantum nelumboides]